MKQGYDSKEYQEVYSKFGEVQEGILKQNLGNGYSDLITVYPFRSGPYAFLQFFSDWSDPKYDSEYVSGTFITDPLDSYNEYLWKNAENSEKYKEHFIVNLKNYAFDRLPENHKRNIKRNRKNFEIGEYYTVTDICLTKPSNHVFKLYNNLKERHSIKEGSWTNYDEKQIEQLLKVPGAILFRSLCYNSDFHLESTQAYSLFYIQGDNVYYHLSCQSDLGYKMKSNFTMMHDAIMFFKNLGFRELLLGGAPDNSVSNGLHRFKKGFSTRSSYNYIIKHIYNKEQYDILSKGKEGDFFPLYRSQ